MLGDPALACILMSSVETTGERSEVEVPSTAVMDIHRSMKSHVAVPLRRQAPGPRNRQSPVCEDSQSSRTITTAEVESDCQEVVGTAPEPDLRIPLMSPLAWSRDGCRVAQNALESTTGAEQLALAGQLQVFVPADDSPPTLRTEALSSVSSASLNLTFDEDIQFEGTRTVDLCTNSVAGSGAGCAHAENADGSFAVHPVISENVFLVYFGCRVGPGIASEPNCVRSY